MTRHHYILEFEAEGLKPAGRFRMGASVLVTDRITAEDIARSLEFDACKEVMKRLGIQMSANRIKFHMISLVHTTHQ